MIVMSTAITVAIVEDNRGTREGLVELLGRTQNLHCVGAYASGEDAVRDLPAQKPRAEIPRRPRHQDDPKLAQRLPKLRANRRPGHPQHAIRQPQADKRDKRKTNQYRRSTPPHGHRS